MKTGSSPYQREMRVAVLFFAPLSGVGKAAKIKLFSFVCYIMNDLELSSLWYHHRLRFLSALRSWRRALRSSAIL